VPVTNWEASIMLAASCLVLTLGLLAPEPVENDLPVVVLIGDSIRLGYGPFVAEKLKGKARVISPEENGGDSTNVLNHLDEWAIASKPAVVHFNTGLHDLKRDPAANYKLQVDLATYESNLKSIVLRLEDGTAARLLFATTTPVLDLRHNANKPFHRRQADVHAYNAAARKVMGRSPVVRVVDLQATVEALGPETALVADGVHFTQGAYEALAAQVAANIEKALDEPPAMTEAVCRLVEKAPVLDGELDDPAWKQAQRIERFPTFWEGRPSDLRTVAWLCWDDDALYYAATMADDEIYAFGEKRNDTLWLGDVFEMFLKPAEDRPEYYEFQVNPRGVILELAFPRRGFSFEELAAKPPLGMSAVIKVRGTVNHPADEDTRWSVEGKVPWSLFKPTGGRPEPGAVWRFALCRYDYEDGGKNPTLMSSAPLRRPSFHRYEDYGKLKFEGNGR
jgi:lysophospholipase L1-like esterase